MEDDLIIIDINNPQEIKYTDELVLLLNLSEKLFSLRLCAYLTILRKLRIRYLENYFQDSKFINYCRYLSDWYYIFNMYTDKKRYKIKDIDKYDLKTKSDIVFEFEGIITFFYLTLGKKVPNYENIKEKYSRHPVFLLQKLYKLYVNKDYEIIKDPDSYLEDITFII